MAKETRAPGAGRPREHEPFEKTTSQKVKRNQTGEKGRLLTPS